jgi:hypothetical protein
VQALVIPYGILFAGIATGIIFKLVNWKIKFIHLLLIPVAWLISWKIYEVSSGTFGNIIAGCVGGFSIGIAIKSGSEIGWDIVSHITSKWAVGVGLTGPAVYIGWQLAFNQIPNDNILFLCTGIVMGGWGGLSSIHVIHTGEK